MSTLHIVSPSPHANNALESCLRIASAEDGILLIHDGVYAALQVLDTQARCYALQADIDARGLSNRVNSAITVVDDAGFVDLSIDYDKSQSWY